MSTAKQRGHQRALVESWLDGFESGWKWVTLATRELGILLKQNDLTRDCHFLSRAFSNCNTASKSSNDHFNGCCSTGKEVSTSSG